MSSRIRRLCLLQAGANRGGRELQTRLLEHPVLARIGNIEVLDPEPGRADALARAYQDWSVVAHGRQVPVEDAISQADPQAVAVLAIDDVGAMGRALSQAPGDAIAQVLGRGPTALGVPGPAFGIGAYVFPERPAARQLASELFEALAQVAPPRSSIAVREDPLNARRALHLRQQTSARTVDVLDELSCVRESEILAELTWAQRRFPLVLAQRDAGGPVLDQAQDLAHGIDAVAVALMDRLRGRVDVLVLERFGRQRVLRLHVPLAAPPAPSRWAGPLPGQRPTARPVPSATTPRRAVRLAPLLPSTFPAEDSAAFTD